MLLTVYAKCPFREVTPLSETTFEMNFSLRSSDFDAQGRIKPSAVLDIFQEVATRHAEELGTGFDEMLAHKMFWVLTKVRYTVHNPLHFQQDVKVLTRAYTPKLVEFRRDFAVYGKDGTLLITGASMWTVISSETRRIVRTTNLYGKNVLSDEYFFDGEILRLPDFKGERLKKTQTAEYSDLDRNGHVNNRRYADFAQNVLDFHGEIQNFQINFHREILLGDTVEFYYEKSGNSALIRGVKDNKPMYECFEEYKK